MNRFAAGTFYYSSPLGRQSHKLEGSRRQISSEHFWLLSELFSFFSHLWINLYFLLHVSNNWGLALETLLLLYSVKLGSKMSQFKPERFLSEPDKEIFCKLRKDDLISLGEYLELEVKSHMRKNEIQDVIISHLVSTKVFKESDVKRN